MQYYNLILKFLRTVENTVKTGIKCEFMECRLTQKVNSYSHEHTKIYSSAGIF